METLIEFKWTIFLLVLFIGLFLFRRELNKLLDWIVSFRKIAGAKGSYKVSAETESPGSLSESNIKEKKNKSVEKKAEIVAKGKTTKERDWVSSLDKKDYDKALEILEEDLSSEHDVENLNQIRSFIGHVKFEKDNKEGIEYFEKALKETQGSVAVYYWYALSYYSKNECDQVMDILKRGMDSNLTEFYLYELFADCLVELSREIEAVEMLFDHLKQDPKIPTHYTSIVKILSEMGKKELARDCCRLGFKHCPDDESLLNEYGNIVTKMKDYKEAMLVYRRLTKKKPEEAMFWTLLGNQYLMLSFDDLALEAYKKGNELAEESRDWIISNIGNIMNSRGFYTEGASYLKKAISINPNSQYAYDRLSTALKNANEEVEKRDALEKEVLKAIRNYRSPEDIISEAKNLSSQQGDSIDG